MTKVTTVEQLVGLMVTSGEVNLVVYGDCRDDVLFDSNFLDHESLVTFLEETEVGKKNAKMEVTTFFVDSKGSMGIVAKYS